MPIVDNEDEREGISSLAIMHEVIAGVSCVVARSSGSAFAPGALVVLDGTRVLRRVDRLVAEGRLDPACLPLMVGIDPDPADRGLAQYTPWSHPAYKPGAPDFGGGAEVFLADTVLPVATALRREHPEGPIGLFGYSLAGLFGLFAMLNTDVFSRIFSQALARGIQAS